MRCPDCGQINPEGSRFCNHCGARLSPAPQALVSEIIDDEQIIFVIRSTLVFVMVRYALVVLLTLAAGGVYWYANQRRPNTLPWWVVLIVAVVALLPALYHHILRQREIYTLTNHKIEFTYGLIAKLRRNIPLRNIQDVTVTRSILERLLGIGDIVIDSAAQEGRIPLRNIHEPERYADMILHEIRRYQR